MSFFRGATRSASLLGRAASTVRRVIQGSGPVTRTIVGAGVGLLAADALVIPAAESVTGRDLPGGTIARDAISGAANGAGQVLGVAQASGTRGIAEGAVMGLLPNVSDSESRGLVTVAVLVIGATFLLSALRR